MPDLAEKYKVLSTSTDKEIGYILEEFSAAITHLGNDRRFIRTRLLLGFSFLEVMCTIYNTYYDLRLANRELLKKWIREYCLVDKNLVYKQHEDIKKLTDEHLYKFRCSVIHAFAFPEPENGLSIVVPNGSEKSDILEKYKDGFKKAGHNVTFISPDSLTSLFITGGRLLIEEMFGNTDNISQDRYDGLQRIKTEIERRGAKGIPLA